MRFTWKETGDREYDGPTTEYGLLEGWPMGALRWLKQQLKIKKVEDLDAVEGRMAYYFLTIRRDDHTLLPISRWNDLVLADFELVRHVMPGTDPDGDCSECHFAPDAYMHLHPEPGDDDTTPTSGPSSTTEVTTPT